MPISSALKPAVLTGPTWERLSQALYSIPDDKHGAVVAAANHQGEAEALLAMKIGRTWQIAGSVGYAGGKPSAAVMIVGTW